MWRGFPPRPGGFATANQNLSTGGSPRRKSTVPGSPLAAPAATLRGQKRFGAHCNSSWQPHPGGAISVTDGNRITAKSRSNQSR